MPTYDFTCSDCGSYFDVVCKISERSNKHKCPNCSSEKTERAYLSAPQINADPIDGNQHRKAFSEVLGKIHSQTAGSILDKTSNIK